MRAQDLCVAMIAVLLVPLRAMEKLGGVVVLHQVGDRGLPAEDTYHRLDDALGAADVDARDLGRTAGHPLVQLEPLHLAPGTTALGVRQLVEALDQLGDPLGQLVPERTGLRVPYHFLDWRHTTASLSVVYLASGVANEVMCLGLASTTLP